MTEAIESIDSQTPKDIIIVKIPGSGNQVDNLIQDISELRTKVQERIKEQSKAQATRG